jgi:hypothetical protein
MLSVLRKLRTVETKKVHRPLLSVFRENWTVETSKNYTAIVETF